MWNFFVKCFSSYLVLFHISPVSSQNVRDTKILHSDLFQDYNKGIRPIDKQVDVLNISVSYYFERLVDIDEVQESMTSIALLEMKWTDDSLKMEFFCIQWDKVHICATKPYMEARPYSSKCGSEDCRDGPTGLLCWNKL